MLAASIPRLMPGEVASRSSLWTAFKIARSSENEILGGNLHATARAVEPQPVITALNRVADEFAHGQGQFSMRADIF